MILTMAIVAVACGIVARERYVTDQKAIVSQRSFIWSSLAVEAPLETMKVQDKAAISKVFGPISKDFLAVDEVKATATFHRLSRPMAESDNPQPKDNDTIILKLGRNN